MSENSQLRNKDFYGRDFLISSDVLIPRPETEQLIDMVLSLYGKAYLPGVRPSERRISKKPVIFDVGTGSGCIAITLKLEIPEAKVVALDISPEALKVARTNAERLGAEVEFHKSDLLSEVEIPDGAVVVANLPYVDPDWGWLDKKALGIEPDLALYAEDGGLALYKRFFEELSATAAEFVIVEADPCQHEELAEIAARNGFEYEKTAGFILQFKHQRQV